MHFGDELVDADTIKFPKAVPGAMPSEVNYGPKKLIEGMTTKWDPDKYRFDEGIGKTGSSLSRNDRGEMVKHPAKKNIRRPRYPKKKPGPNIIDLMSKCCEESLSHYEKRESSRKSAKPKSPGGESTASKSRLDLFRASWLRQCVASEFIEPMKALAVGPCAAAITGNGFMR